MQVAHIRVGATPVDIGQGLAAGCYRGQVQAERFGDEALVAYGSAAPSDLSDWFRVGHDHYFEFRSGAGADPCWVRSSSSDTSVRVARRRVT